MAPSGSGLWTLGSQVVELLGRFWWYSSAGLSMSLGGGLRYYIVSPSFQATLSSFTFVLADAVSQLPALASTPAARLWASLS